MGKKSRFTSDVLHGSLEMLILKTLVHGPAHGYAIARRLEQVSGSVLQVGESSLYPALQRLLVHGWVKAAWGDSETNRRARFYRITPSGRKRLAEESAAFTRLTDAIAAVLQTG
jgi:PadR family transcriptional regulator